jgi:hypothetical protein
MDASHLRDTYIQLRHQLDAAYAAPVWDSQQIDRITDQLSPLEIALASAQAHPTDDGRDGG